MWKWRFLGWVVFHLWGDYVLLAVLCSFAILSTAGLHVLLAITDQSSGNQRTGMIEFEPILGANQTLDATTRYIPENLTCPQKRDYSNRTYIFHPLIFRGFIRSFSGEFNKFEANLQNFVAWSLGLWYVIFSNGKLQECSFHSSSDSRSFDHLRSTFCHHAAVTDWLDRVLVESEPWKMWENSQGSRLQKKSDRDISRKTLHWTCIFHALESGVVFFLKKLSWKSF